MKKIIIILTIITLFLGCRLIHLFENENSVNTTTTTTITTNPMILVLDENEKTIVSKDIINIGAFPVTVMNIEKKFFIKNNGGAELKIEEFYIQSSGTVEITQEPKRNLAIAETTEFRIKFTFSDNNISDFSADVFIKSNDPHMNLFNFKIFGRRANFLYVSKNTGNDSNEGTSIAPYETINKALSVASTDSIIAVAAGVYDETIDINKNISLYGGYYCDVTTVNWDDRNIFEKENLSYKTHIRSFSYETIKIEGTGITSSIEIQGFVIENTGDLINEARVISISNINATQGEVFIKDNNILAKMTNSQNIKVINIENCLSKIKILNNFIQSGIPSSNTTSSAIQSMSSDVEISVEIRGNAITGIDDNTTDYSFYGINIMSSENTIIEGNVIRTPVMDYEGTTYSYAIYVNSSQISIRNNELINKNARECFGIYTYVSSKSYIDIENNKIKTENTTTYQKYIGIVASIADAWAGNLNIFNNSILDYGNTLTSGVKQEIYINNSSSSFNINLYNNVVYINRTNNSVNTSALVTGGTNIKILNNTLFIAKTDSYNVVKGIEIENNSSPEIENNIIFLNKSSGGGSSDNTNDWAMYEIDTNSNPLTIKNNNVFGFSNFYYDAIDNGDINNVNDFNDANKTNQRYSSTVGNNNNPHPVFINPANPEDNGLMLDPLTPVNIKNGGISQNIIFNRDKIYNQRTEPWSIGAYECDN